MALLDWLQLDEKLTPAALTFRAQNLPADDSDRLLYPIFFPRSDVASVKVSDIASTDWRPVLDRRAWNAPGRRLGLRTPAIRELEMLPIEGNYKLEERELQALTEQRGLSESIVRSIIAPTIPGRVDTLTQASWRTVERDAMNAWALGQVTVRNPETNGTIVVSYGFDAARYTTAGTAFNAVGGWDEFVAWYTAARQLCGPGQGVVMRWATLAGLLTQAPNLLNGAKMRRSEVQDELSQTFGEQFTFLTVEDSFDEHQTAGTATTRVAKWPAQRVAFIPLGGTVGRTAIAPNMRVPGDSQLPLRRNDIGVSYFEHGNGRELDIEVQVNALTIPDESKVCVINAGV